MVLGADSKVGLTMAQSASAEPNPLALPPVSKDDARFWRVWRVMWPWQIDLWPLTFRTKIWHCSNSCRGERLRQFWFFCVSFFEPRAHTGPPFSTCWLWNFGPSFPVLHFAPSDICRLLVLHFISGPPFSAHPVGRRIDGRARRIMRPIGRSHKNVSLTSVTDWCCKATLQCGVPQGFVVLGLRIFIEYANDVWHLPASQNKTSSVWWRYARLLWRKPKWCCYDSLRATKMCH